MIAEYDYIIVGAGAAGCVLANRLTEDPDVTVLLLEAGGWDRSIYMNIPLGWRQIWRGPRFGWNYSDRARAVPRRPPRSLCRAARCWAAPPRSTACSMSAAIPRDYDLWRQQGCEGWSYADVLPYFRQSESNWRGEAQVSRRQRSRSASRRRM